MNQRWYRKGKREEKMKQQRQKKTPFLKVIGICIIQFKCHIYIRLSVHVPVMTKCKEPLVVCNIDS